MAEDCHKAFLKMRNQERGIRNEGNAIMPYGNCISIFATIKIIPIDLMLNETGNRKRLYSIFCVPSFRISNFAFRIYIIVQNTLKFPDILHRQNLQDWYPFYKRLTDWL